jgi:tetratricopeptide (TPR) repeat protein
MGEYRRQDWSAALEWLNPVETSNSLEGSAVAWAFGAMARHRLGDTQGARQALEQVNRRLSAVIRTGQLGWWQEIARALVARDEAERLIFGKITSPLLNSSEILENRTKWQACSFSLNAGNTMASQSQWIPAAEYYAKALQDPVFDWSISELKEDYLSMQSAVAFLMAEDRTNFCALVRGLAARKMENLSPTVQERYGQIFVINPDFLTPELKQQALAFARRVCDNPERANTFWIRLLRGETEYRHGNFETAVDMLGPLIFSSTETLGAARGKVFLALALKRLGKSKDSLEAMQEANGLFIKAMSQGGDRVNQIYYQVMMNELLAMLANPPGASQEKN